MRRGELQTKVMEVIENHWPVHIKEVVRWLGLEVNNSNIKKIAYHVKQLERFEKVRTKRIGKALVVWPHDIEKLRVIYELVKVE
jgi:predicted transcriptional regulator